MIMKMNDRLRTGVVQDKHTILRKSDRGDKMVKHTTFFMAMMLVVLSLSICGEAQSIVSHAISMRGEPKYPADFTHFEYVNPDAPKGGMLTLHSIGTYDSFHRYAQRGNSADGIGVLYDSLMTGSDDEVEVYYYNDPVSSTYLDRYAIFYKAGTELLVDYGQLDLDGNPTDIIQSVTLCDNVEAINFSKNGACIQMVLRLDDGSESLVVMTSAIRQSEDE